MKIRFVQTRHGVIISFFGLAALLLVAGMLILPYFLVPAPGPKEAEQRIRLLLKREFFDREMAVLREKGRKLPGYDRARQWEREIKRIDRIRFLSTTVNRLIPDILLLDATPTFVVRVKVQEKGGKARTRYFLLRTDGIDRETTYLPWFFSFRGRS
jgi:hypothetical protein